MNLTFTTRLILTFAFSGILLGACSQNTKSNEIKSTMSTTKTIQIEIWSDVMCPFCYIGKRKFEAALAKFDHKNNVEVVWKSYLLDSELQSDDKKSIHQHLADAKGWSLDYAKEMSEYVSNMAKEAGLNYNMDKVKVANTFDAHRLIQFAKSKQKGDAAEEALFKAYFIDGKNLADLNTLQKIGEEIGLSSGELKTLLTGTAFQKEVKSDLNEAESIGVSGVPFFVIDRKFAVSGAQPVDTFLNALHKAWKNE